MVRYYFHVDDGKRNIDHIGVDLVDLMAARTEASQFTGDMLMEIPEHVFSAGTWSLRVTDKRGSTLLEIVVSAKSFADIH